MILKWLKKLFKKWLSSSAGKKLSWPTPEKIASLPWFDGLTLENIHLVETREAAEQAYNELVHHKVLGFDTESKPTFVKGQKSTGPHVIQFSTTEKAYIFMIHQADARRFANLLIKAPQIQKVGFGLSDDIKRIQSKLRIQPQSVLDIETVFSAKGYGRGVGVKVGVAIAFKKRFKKSKKAATSNWGATHLSPSQILYAANDAYAAIKVFEKMST